MSEKKKLPPFDRGLLKNLYAPISEAEATRRIDEFYSLLNEMGYPPAMIRGIIRWRPWRISGGKWYPCQSHVHYVQLRTGERIELPEPMPYWKPEELVRGLTDLQTKKHETSSKD